MLQDLGRISDALAAAEASAGRANPEQAVASLDRAMEIAENIRQRRNQALRNATETWFPRVPEANGRRFLNAVDDVKDHQPVRTVDMSYLVYRELLYPLGKWMDRVVAARNSYAIANKLPTRTYQFRWEDTSADATTQRSAGGMEN